MSWQQECLSQDVPNAELIQKRNNPKTIVTYRSHKNTVSYGILVKITKIPNLGTNTTVVNAVIGLP